MLLLNTWREKQSGKARAQMEMYRRKYQFSHLFKPTEFSFCQLLSPVTLYCYDWSLITLDSWAEHAHSPPSLDYLYYILKQKLKRWNTFSTKPRILILHIKTRTQAMKSYSKNSLSPYTTNNIRANIICILDASLSSSQLQEVD